MENALNPFWSSNYFNPAFSTINSVTKTVQEGVRSRKVLADLINLSSYLQDIVISLRKEPLKEDDPADLPAGETVLSMKEKALVLLRQMNDRLDSMLEKCRRAGLMDQAKTAAIIHSISNYNEELKDHQDALEASIDEDVLQSLKDAEEDFREGRTIKFQL